MAEAEGLLGGFITETNTIITIEILLILQSRYTLLRQFFLTVE